MFSCLLGVFSQEVLALIFLSLNLLMSGIAEWADCMFCDSSDNTFYLTRTSAQVDRGGSTVLPTVRAHGSLASPQSGHLAHWPARRAPAAP